MKSPFDLIIEQAKLSIEDFIRKEKLKEITKPNKSFSIPIEPATKNKGHFQEYSKKKAKYE